MSVQGRSGQFTIRIERSSTPGGRSRTVILGGNPGQFDDDIPMLSQSGSHVLATMLYIDSTPDLPRRELEEEMETSKVDQTLLVLCLLNIFLQPWVLVVAEIHSQNLWGECLVPEVPTAAQELEDGVTMSSTKKVLCTPTYLL